MRSGGMGHQALSWTLQWKALLLQDGTLEAIVIRKNRGQNCPSPYLSAEWAPTPSLWQFHGMPECYWSFRRCYGGREQGSWAHTVPHEEVEDGEEEMNWDQLLSTLETIFQILYKDLTKDKVGLINTWREIKQGKRKHSQNLVGNKRKIMTAFHCFLSIILRAPSCVPIHLFTRIPRKAFNLEILLHSTQHRPQEGISVQIN